MGTYDFSGWATRVDLKCSDGRIIRKDAFKHCDGQKVPLVWNHQHERSEEVLGHAMLENRDEGVYAYCKFNNTESGKNAKLLVQHGDVNALSIYANQLKQQGPNVIHGAIREVSLVLAGANPGAFIDSIMMHGEESEEEAIIYTGEEISLYHSDDEEYDEEYDDEEYDDEEYDDEEYDDEEYDDEEYDDDEYDDEYDDDEYDDEEFEHAAGGATIGEVIESMTEEQQNVLYALVGQAYSANNEDDEEDDADMKHNIFDREDRMNENVLSHADETEIIKLAKSNGGNSLKQAIADYIGEDATLAHGDDHFNFVDADGNDAIDTLFPEYKLVKPGAPELLERDLTWVDHVMRGVHKSPISRIRTRFADARIAELRAKGYQKKGDEKTLSGNIKLAGRTTDPQTVYRKDQMHRDDVLDITDFDVVEYQYKVMRHNLEEELALAFMIGDGREEGDPDKISEEHIRSIWHDDDLYTIHADVDMAKMKAELQGSNTSANFGENYIYAEAIIQASLYSREQYKGRGNLEFYCTPHLLNVMLLARDLNGRRIYSSKSDLAAALNVKAIHTVEQFEGKTRTTKDGEKKKLLGMFVNLDDYHVGSTKGGEITRFSDFDIDFNTYKYLIETRLSGAMVNLYSAIALEEPITEEAAG